MNLKSIDILFLVLLFVSIIVIGFLLSMPIGLLLEGVYNKYTILQMGIFIPASVFAQGSQASVQDNILYFTKSQKGITYRSFVSFMFAWI